MEAYGWTDGAGMNADDTLPSWLNVAFDREARESGVVLASERPTVPPPSDSPDGTSELAGLGVMVSRIHLGPTVDEVIYRLSLGDLTGAALANEELEGYVPRRGAASASVMVAALGLTYVEEYILALVDGVSTWGEILDGSPFSPRDTLSALCELVDNGAITLG